MIYYIYDIISTEILYDIKISKEIFNRYSEKMLRKYN